MHPEWETGGVWEDGWSVRWLTCIQIGRRVDCERVDMHPERETGGVLEGPHAPRMGDGWSLGRREECERVGMHPEQGTGEVWELTCSQNETRVECGKTDGVWEDRWSVGRVDMHPDEKTYAGECVKLLTGCVEPV